MSPGQPGKLGHLTLGDAPCIAQLLEILRNSARKLRLVHLRKVPGDWPCVNELAVRAR